MATPPCDSRPHSAGPQGSMSSESWPQTGKETADLPGAWGGLPALKATLRAGRHRAQGQALRPPRLSCRDKPSLPTSEKPCALFVLSFLNFPTHGLRAIQTTLHPLSAAKCQGVTGKAPLWSTVPQAFHSRLVSPKLPTWAAKGRRHSSLSGSWLDYQSSPDFQGAC